jgi:hypothetical protein|tara:strand:+ start:44 stop:235 length:192 start_codon:yes stop_codon:yes gene_type:complete
MALKQLVSEVGDVLILNTTILSVATFSNLETLLKIVLLLVSILYTANKWYYQNKKRDGEKKDN